MNNNDDPGGSKNMKKRKIKEDPKRTLPRNGKPKKEKNVTVKRVIKKTVKKEVINNENDDEFQNTTKVSDGKKQTNIENISNSRKKNTAERAKELGLEEPAMAILNNTNNVNLADYIVADKKEIAKIEDVEKGVIHIMAYIFATDTDVLSHLRQLRSEVNFILETKKSASKSESKAKPAVKKETKGKPIDESKFENYFDYKIPVKYVKPHQILAINRGENNKILSVKIVVPDFVFNKFHQFCSNKWIKKGNWDVNRKRIIDDAIKDSYNRLVQPLIIREIRSELKSKAEKASCDVFSTNLKQLLLTAPLKGKPILAIDPGYSNGCKLALVSQTGSLLSYNVIYLLKTKGQMEYAELLKTMLDEHKYGFEKHF
ncbi:hypothetical protein NQ317_013775 [Molorchus minor]|uniref:Uncharacterized protein n=1 Tax=Molorchus minor TaxID=1323400 RepID=A0ABQ9IWM3_9CUCU|nr:hypothetical protein NQ317_013775 [Molorchus minor]